MLYQRTTIDNQAGGFPAPPGFEKNLDNPDNNALASIPSGWTLISIAIILLILRFVAKVSTTVKEGKFNIKVIRVEDWLALLAVLCGIVRVVLVTYIVLDLGIGRHIWDIPGENFPKIWHIFDIEDMIYCWGILFAKLSILFFYLSIFRINKAFRICVYVTMAITTLYLLVSFLTYVFHCGVHTWVGIATKCLDGITQEIAIGGFNIATDLVIMVLPLPLALRLQLSRKKKIGLVIVLLLGSFTIIAAVLRQVFAITTLSTSDQTWNTSEVVVWKTVEMLVAIICCNILTGPFILRYLLDTKLGSSLRSLLTKASPSFATSVLGSDPSSHRYPGKRSDNGSATTESYEVNDIKSWAVAAPGRSDSHEQLTRPSTEGIKVTRDYRIDTHQAARV
ncbi:hypothetical protein EJ05DRAFT_312531 [Pseudovirgaria hyperparasitica]|uniref:Rhodopsin domain-containing protein n=1 Tax=Pseudovirgaria hyperparasitica TaxID=470096 RepID=A0A6A6WB30_9PEZI|nr:uncharacterized protein EJ05DRAFT_312531 [Pseudovirgaria hyperparasitica]KAF2759883.1 hypothetical protein EJ05DRAFT_312531 [Pseudovirgaria hyperparasitica]